MVRKGLIILLLAVATFIQTKTVAAEPKPVAFESPQQVFKAMRDAQVAQDWEGMYRCMTPRSLDLSIGLCIFTVGYHEGNPDIGEPLRDILKKHGMDFDQIKKETRRLNDSEEERTGAHLLNFVRKITHKVKDKPAMLGEAMKWQMTARMKRETENEKKEYREGMKKALQAVKAIRLVDVKIEGDKATGTRIIPDSTDKNTIEFCKVNGSWLIEYDPR